MPSCILTVSSSEIFTQTRDSCTCFTTQMLQNKELLSRKQWHPKIGNADRTVRFLAFKMYILLRSEIKLRHKERN